MERTKLERFESVKEVEQKVYDLKLHHEIGGKILLKVIENYILKGTTYIDKKIKLHVRGDIERVIIINLFNNKNIKDVIKIEAVEI